MSDNLGVMFNGGGQVEDRQENDFYPTPPEVPDALVTYFGKDLFPKKVAEVACGKGDMAEVFRVHGCDVESSDLIGYGYGQSGKDFLLTQEKYTDQAIITNPPFDLAAAFIRTAVNTESPFIAFVLKSTYWAAYKRRGELFMSHRPSHVLQLGWRPDFLKKGAPTMDVIWCVWDRRTPYTTTAYDLLPPPQKSR